MLKHTKSLQTIKKSLPVVVLVSGLVAFFVLGGSNYLSLESLSNHYSFLHSFTQNHYLISVLLYIILYILVIAFSIPGATIMTLMGGFLFGIPFGILWVVIAACSGATITYFAVKYFFGNLWLNKKNNKNLINKMRQGFQKNELNYLLFLRMMPIFPFFLINIAAGILNVKAYNFILGTFVGIIPGSLIYVWVGNNFGYILSQGQNINMKIIFSMQILMPIIILAILPILPILYKKIKKRESL